MPRLPLDPLPANLCSARLVGSLLLTQLIGVVALALLGFVPLYLICSLLQKHDMLRTTEVEEIMGIDQYVFQIHAYIVRFTLPEWRRGSRQCLAPRRPLASPRPAESAAPDARSLAPATQ